MEIFNSKKNITDISNLDLKELKIFVQNNYNEKPINDNILTNKEKKTVKKYLRNKNKQINLESCKKSKFLNNLSNFKNFDQLINDYRLYENSYETDTSIKEISKAFGFKSDFNYFIKNSENIETFSMTEHEKMTLDILECSDDISFDLKNQKNNLGCKRNSEEIMIKNKNPNNFNIDYNKINNEIKTTLMIKNIPNKFTKELLIKMINKNHKDKYNYFHLPIDISNNCNMGYAFINFIKNAYIKDFYNEYNNKKWNLFNSEKICEIKYARYQGFDYYKNYKKQNNINIFDSKKK